MARGREPDRGFDDVDDDAPWLAEGVPEPRATTLVSRGRLFGGILLFLGLGVLVALGIYLVSARKQDGSGGYARPEDAPLIAADPGPYKVPPKTPGGMEAPDTSETIYPAATGADPGSSIDIGALAEEPMARSTAPTPAATAPTGDATATAGPPVDLLPPAATAPAPTAAPQTVRIEPTKVMPPKPKEATAPALPPPPKPAGTASLQLGAFSTKANADAAWKTISGRFAYLAGLDKRVDTLTRDGTTLYRLRAGGVASRAAAADLCARLKIAGEPCLVAE